MVLEQYRRRSFGKACPEFIEGLRMTEEGIQLPGGRGQRKEKGTKAGDPSATDRVAMSF